MINSVNRAFFAERVRSIVNEKNIVIEKNLIKRSLLSPHHNQQHTNEAFSEKWEKYNRSNEKNRLYDFQRNWYLKLYGFPSETALAEYLSSKTVVFDAGCGLGYKAAWFAKLAPRALVIGMDFSDAAVAAAKEYEYIENLFFIQGDIADTGLTEGSVDYTSCDQVIMHTEDPIATFGELARITASNTGEFACYFYAKKALPRELLDDFFRNQCKEMGMGELWEMSEQLTELGKRLSELKVSFHCPEITALGIKAGNYDIQRFIYWNFIKCFWNEGLGWQTSVSTNFDWYSPSNARRFDEREIRDVVDRFNMVEVFFHAEEACFSGRFKHA